MKKRLVSSILALSVVAIVITRCGSPDSGKTETATAAVADSGGSGSSAAEEEPAGDTQVMIFWYSSTGDEAKIYEDATTAYNAPQSKYRMEGLGAIDGQRMVVAMSNNEAPDVIKHGNQTVIQYATNGSVKPLEGYVEAENSDLLTYSDQAVNANRVDGNLYALPLDACTTQMYYNKTLLKKAGYTESPKTMEEIYEMAVEATRIDGNSNIDVLGCLPFPYASAGQELIYGFGSRWWNEDSNLTFDNQGIPGSLDMNMKLREGSDGKVFDSLIGAANANCYTEQDTLFQGEQLPRLDGSWLPVMTANFNLTVDYGITSVPGTEAHSGYKGVSRFETDSTAITSVSSSKDGVWGFTKWLCSVEGAKIINLGTGNFPAIKFFYDDPEILAVPGFTEFTDVPKEERGVQCPQMSDYDEYTSLVNPASDTVYPGKTTPEGAMHSLEGQSIGLE